MLNSVNFLSILVFMFFVASRLHSQTPQEIAKNALGSTVLIVMEDANGQPLSLGSGFFVGDGEIASNRHVVEGAARGYVKAIGQNKKHDIEGISAIDARRDLVILKISASASAHLAHLPLGDSDSVEIGEPVYAVGNPQGLEGTFSQGIISSIRKWGTDRLLQITAPISPGSSGGPVLNSRGEVIGVSVAFFRNGQNLNFAIPVNYLSALLGKVGPTKPLSQVKSAKAAESIMADLGDPNREGVVGKQLIWANSNFGSAGGAFDFWLLRKICGSPPEQWAPGPKNPGFSRHPSGVRWTLHECARISTLEVPGETESGSAGTQPGEGYSGRWCADGASDPGSPMVSGVAFFCAIGHLSHA